MMSRIFSLTLALPLLGGCASQIGAFFSRPVVQDQLPGAVSTFSQSADRRTVIVSLQKDSIGKFCAEPPPDSATALKTDLTMKLEAAQGRKAELGDKLSTDVVQLSERTANLDGFRTGVYALCQFNLNGALSGAEVKEMFELLARNFTAVELAAAGAPRARPATPVAPQTSEGAASSPR